MKCCFRSAGVSKDLASKHKRIQKHIGPFKAMFFFQRLVKNMCFLHLFKSPMKKIIKLLGCRSETCWKPVGHGFSRNQPLQDSLPPCPSRQRWMFLARVQRTDWETTLLGKSGKKKNPFINRDSTSYPCVTVTKKHTQQSSFAKDTTCCHTSFLVYALAHLMCQVTSFPRGH